MGRQSRVIKSNEGKKEKSRWMKNEERTGAGIWRARGMENMKR